MDLGGWLKIPPAGIAKGSHLDVKKRTSFPTEFSIFFRQMYSALARQCRHTTLIFSYFISDAFPPKENKKWTIFSESEIWLELRKIRRHASAVIVRNSAKGRARKSNRSISMSDNHLLPLTLMLPLWVINNYKQNLNESAHFVFDARFREFWIRRNPNSINCCESYYFCGQKLIRNDFPGRDIRAFLRNSMQQVFKDT